MSLSNTGSAQKASAEISSLSYLRPSAWRGMSWFPAPKRDQVQWATGALRGCGMDAAGVGRGAGVKSR